MQFCGIGRDTVEAIADVNPDKFGALTPGTHIPSFLNPRRGQ